MTARYVDHHVHLMATVAARLSTDVGAARSLEEMGRLVAAAGGRGWVRAWGYEEWLLAERRHPTRQDLDRWLPGRPVVVHHRTGHAAVLNSLALREVGAPEHRDGLLVDRHDLLSRVPRMEEREMAAAAAAVAAGWAAAGVGAVVDATHTNGPDELDTLARWRATGVLLQEVTAMVGLDHAGRVPPFGARSGAVAVGPVKLMPAALPAGCPSLGAAVVAAHAAGFPVAVHVVDVDVLEETLQAFERSPAPEGTRDRIEHNALSLPEQVGRIAATGAVVVVNPSFLIHRRAKYEAELTEVERSWLIRVASLVRAGITVRAGSDSPVTPSLPEEMMAAAGAHPFAPCESVGRVAAEMLVAPLAGASAPLK